MELYRPCDKCGSTGVWEGEDCDQCNGTKIIRTGELGCDLADILNKCNGIKEVVDEIKEVVDAL